MIWGEVPNNATTVATRRNMQQTTTAAAAAAALIDVRSASADRRAEATPRNNRASLLHTQLLLDTRLLRTLRPNDGREAASI